MKVRWIIVVGFGLLVALAITRLDRGAAQGPTVIINVDASANRRSINPNIYGVAFASTSQLADLNSPLNRSGGNATSQYNWQCNCDNRGSDWYFESLDSGSSVPGKLNDDFISATKAGNSQTMLTIPTIGWVAKLGPSRSKLASFSQAKYNYTAQANDWQWFADAGNGIRKSNGSKVTGNDPNDANIPANSTFQQGWIQHLVGTWGNAANGGLRYYIMDNEPSLWQETHRDVHPTGPMMDEIKNAIVDYSAKVKATDPSALVAAPEEWGWPGYFYSGYDQQLAPSLGWDPSKFPDRQSHGGADYLPWMLDQLHQHDQQTGQRSLDVFTVHWYPQGSQSLGLGSEAFSNDTSPAMSNLRNRSTRSLWDPNYTDQSWINSKVFLIPRLRNWVNTYYPGLQIGITEYNWGAEPYINGATTQADVLGIFGREGLEMATRWTTPDSSTPTYKAIKMYRNYDANRSTFGDVSVAAAGPDPDQTAVFAAQRTADGALTVMVVNKVLSGTTPANFNVASFTYMVPLGIGSAAAVRVGHAVGARDAHAAARAGWTALLFGACFMSLSGLCLALFNHGIARVYSPQADVIHAGATLLIVAAVFQLFDGLQVVATGALRGAGNTRTPMLANLFGYWIFGLPLGALLCFPLKLGAVGMWVGLCVALVVVGSSLVVVWRLMIAEMVKEFTRRGAVESSEAHAAAPNGAISQK